MTTFYIPVQPLEISDPLNHFLVALLILIVIFAVVAIWIFAKWLTAGPWFAKKWAKLTKREKETIEGIKVEKGQVIVDSTYLEDLEQRIKKAETPQELLELQLLKEKHAAEKERIEKEIAAKEAEKLAKIESKAEKERIKSEAKQKEKEYREKEKAAKKARKESKEN